MKRLSVLVCLVVSSFCLAQLYPSKTGLLGSMALRLADPVFKTELKISEVQTQKIGEHFKALQAAQERSSEEASKAKPDQYEAIQKRLEKVELDSANKIISVLSQHQKGRLMEIALQDAGPFALRNADVARKIGLSNEQRIKINAVAAKTIATLDEIHAKMGSQLEAAPPGKAGDAKRAAIVKSYEPRLKEIEKTSEAQVLATLTPAQLKNWKTALGVAFNQRS